MTSVKQTVMLSTLGARKHVNRIRSTMVLTGEGRGIVARLRNGRVINMYSKLAFYLCRCMLSFIVASLMSCRYIVP